MYLAPSFYFIWETEQMGFFSSQEEFAWEIYVEDYVIVKTVLCIYKSWHMFFSRTMDIRILQKCRERDK